MVEEREDVGRTSLDRAAEGDQFGQVLRNAGGELGDDALEDLLSCRGLVVPVSGNGALVDVPGDLDGDMVGMRVEHRLELRELMLLEQTEAGAQQPATPVERVPFPAAMPESLLLDALPGLVESVAEQLNDVEGVHHRRRVGNLLTGGGLVAGEPVHRDDVDAVSPGLRAPGQPGLEGVLRPARDHVQQPGRSRLLADRCEVDDDGDVLVTETCVAPDVLVDADRGDPVEARRIVNEEALPLSEDRVVGGVPGHVQRFRDTSDGEVLADDGFQRPPDCGTGEFRPRLSSARRVFAPDGAAGVAAEPADANEERCGAPAERDMRESTRHRPARGAFCAAPATERIAIGRATFQKRPVGRDLLTGDGKAVGIEQAERGQVGRGEGSVGHVEVFRMGECRNFHLRKTSTSLRRPPRRPRIQPRATPSNAKSQICHVNNTGPKCLYLTECFRRTLRRGHDVLVLRPRLFEERVLLLFKPFTKSLLAIGL